MHFHPLGSEVPPWECAEGLRHPEAYNSNFTTSDEILHFLETSYCLVPEEDLHCSQNLPHTHSEREDGRLSAWHTSSSSKRICCRHMLKKS